MTTIAGKTRAAVFCRVGARQNGPSHSLERQRQGCQEVADHLGWEVVWTYQYHFAASGKTGWLPYAEILADARSSRFDLLIAWNADRFSRSMTQLDEFLSQLDDLAVQVRTVGGAVDLGTQRGRTLVRTLSACALFDAADPTP
jgi:site-specific DNA recombinase